MKEISTERVFGILLVKLDQMGISREKLIEGFPVSIEELIETKQRMDWELFVPIMKRFSALVGGPVELERTGLLPQSAKPSRLVGYVLSIVKEPKDLFWALATMAGPAFFSNVKFEYEDISENRIRITLSIPPEYTDCPEFFHVYKGNFSCLPLLHNMPYAIVDMEMEPRMAVYNITIPPSMTLFKRLKRAAAALKGGRGIIEELRVFQRQISESYDRLAAAKKELMENELKLRLFEKLANASHMAALDRLAGGVGHEINNPLMIITLNAEHIAAELEEGKDARKKMQVQIKAINDAKNRIAKIVSALMTIGAGNPEDPPRTVKIESILEVVTNLCSVRFTKRGIRFEIAPYDPELQVLAQRMLTSQALMHLLNNAFEAALESREKWIRIEIEEREEDVLLKVIDSGAGIPESIGERIFDPFFSTREVGQGVGLGLSLARKYIEMQGGELTLDRSCPDTCFSFALKKASLENQPKIRQRSPMTKKH